MAARRSQQEKPADFKLFSQILPAEKWEVTKAGLLLPRQEMFLARAAHSAFLRHTFPAPGPAPELLPPRTGSTRESLFPLRDLLLRPARRGMCADPGLTPGKGPTGDSTAGSGCSACSRLGRNFVSLAWSTWFSPGKTWLKTPEISKSSEETPEETRVCLRSGHGS